MSISSLIHAHSYNYERQLVDGVHGLVSPLRRARLGKRRALLDDGDIVVSPEEPSGSHHVYSRDVDGTSSSTSSSKWTPPSAASFYIPNLPGLDQDSTLTLFGGHIPSTLTSAGPVDTNSDSSTSSSASSSADDDGDAHLFFFMAKAKHIAEREKMVLWLNGGPGCSSFDGALMEIGPLRMAEGQKGKVIEQEGAWNEYANVLFLDQPAGTGYSYVSHAHYVHSGSEAAQQIVTFLHNFYEIFPEYQRMDLYIAGESFAGIWIPYLADALLKTKQVSVNLKGIMIGNGWIDPYNQYPAYLPFAYDSKLLSSSGAGASSVEKANERCNKQRSDIGKDKFPINNGVCEGILNSITETTLQVVNGKTYCVNNYDIRLTDTHPACGMNWPNLLPDMYEYLPKKEVVTAFHATGKTSAWVECNGHVSDSFWARTKPSVSLLPSIVERGVPILLFSGMQDLICNHRGTENLIDDLEWGGSTGKGWTNLSEPLDWYVDGKLVGTWRTERNLSYVQVYNASHMVPFDLPVVAHDMLSRFTSTDYISAAGSAALVPSRIGSEEEAIVGETHPNGTALDSSVSSTEQLDSIESEASTSRSSDAFYNVGAAVLVLLVLSVLGGAFIWRQRRRSGRRASSNMFGLSKGSFPANGHGSTGPSHRQHRRNKSSRISDSLDVRGGGDAEETNELLPMTNVPGSTSHLDLRASQEAALPKGEELFAVGEEDDDEVDSEEEGNLGRAGRKLSSSSEEETRGNTWGRRSQGQGYDAV